MSSSISLQRRLSHPSPTKEELSQINSRIQRIMPRVIPRLLGFKIESKPCCLIGHRRSKIKFNCGISKNSDRENLGRARQFVSAFSFSINHSIYSYSIVHRSQREEPIKEIQVSRVSLPHHPSYPTRAGCGACRVVQEKRRVMGRF
jgi:hypothetical protein